MTTARQRRAGKLPLDISWPTPLSALRTVRITGFRRASPRNGHIMYESLFNSPSHLFGHFEQLRRELDDLFGGSGPSGIRSVAAGSAPAVNIGRTERSVEVYAFAPGLDASKIDVSIDRGVLRISGERKRGVPQGDSEMQVYSRERAS
ncbi:MAG: Hsp20/alpha crystallin family protein, partial [Rubrivivax sp.]